MTIQREPTARHDVPPGWRWRYTCTKCQHQSPPASYDEAVQAGREHEHFHIIADRTALAEIWEAGVLAGLQRSQGGNPANPYRAFDA